MLRDLMQGLSIYTTRPHSSSGYTATYESPFLMSALVLLLVWANAIVWGCIGLYEATRVVF